MNNNDRDRYSNFPLQPYGGINTCNLCGLLKTYCKCGSTILKETPILYSDKSSKGWQLCPKCNGTGNNDFNTQLTVNIPNLCTVCNGKKIISIVTGKPPED